MANKDKCISTNINVQLVNDVHVNNDKSNLYQKMGTTKENTSVVAKVLPVYSNKYMEVFTHNISSLNEVNIKPSNISFSNCLNNTDINGPTSVYKTGTSLQKISLNFGNSVCSNNVTIGGSTGLCFLEIPTNVSKIGVNDVNMLHNSTITPKIYKKSSGTVCLDNNDASHFEGSAFTNGESSKKLFVKKHQYRLLKKSPLKSSSLKKISPIMRQQFRRSYKCKVTSPRKLKFILPKQIRNRPPRTLKAKSIVNDKVGPEKYESLKERFSGLKFSYYSNNQLTTSETGNVISIPICDKQAPCIINATCDNLNTLQSLVLNQDDVLSTEPEDTFSEQQHQLQEEHLVAFLKASSTIVMQRGGKKKPLGGLSKQQKMLQEKIAALSYSPDLKSQENDLVMSYVYRVRKALTSMDPKIFNDFVSLFKNYSSTTDTPENLYFKVCDLLIDFDELKEEFVMFLTVDQAIKVGKFQEYCIFNRMREFVDELKFHTSRQLQNLPKILKAFQMLQNRPNVNQEEFLEVLTPILRFQPHLIESLIRLLPTSQPVESLPDDYEDINLDEDKEVFPEDVEVVNMVDNDAKILAEYCHCHCHKISITGINYYNSQSSQQAKMEHCVSCGLRFIDGRVYLQYGKSLRPAKVIYMTNAKLEIKTSEENNLFEVQNKHNVLRKLKAPEKLLKTTLKRRTKKLQLKEIFSTDTIADTKRRKSSKRKLSKVLK